MKSLTDLQQQLEDAKLDFKRVDEMNLKLRGLVKKMKVALDKHYEYAAECRGDWSDYDGRTHLSVAASINGEVLAEVTEIEKGLK